MESMMFGTLARFALKALVLAAGLLAPAAAFAACQLGMVERAPLLHRAAYIPAAAPPGTVKISYLGHSSFLIETPQGATAVTDYNGMNVPAAVPDIISMNNPHTTHFTDTPNPAIRFVLRGWNPAGGLPAHDVKFRDLRVFNVPTNLGESYDAGFNSSSIFVFEISNLCIAHLGHLHHRLTREQLLKLGRIDVLFVPIDGSSTISHEDALAVIGQVEPRLVIPMHFGFFGSADLFFERAKAVYPIRAEKGSVLVVDRRTLPKRTEIRFLQAESQF
jgi:L-ascorbate metabolism protein UlaG (beta-lactamase superfamily)